MKRNLERRKLKIVGGGLLCCATLSLFSFGFSSWLFTSLNQAEAGFEVQAGDVYDINSIISLNSEFNNIQFSKHGFINEGKIENSTYIQTTLEIKNLIDAREHISSLKNLNELNFQFNLNENSNVNFIQYFNCALSVKSPNNESLSITSDNTLSENKCSSIVKIQNIDVNIDSFLLDIKYNFSKETTNFTTDVYPLLANKNINFNLEIGVDYD